MDIQTNVRPEEFGQAELILKYIKRKFDAMPAHLRPKVLKIVTDALVNVKADADVSAP